MIRFCMWVRARGGLASLYMGLNMSVRLGLLLTRDILYRGARSRLKLNELACDSKQ